MPRFVCTFSYATKRQPIAFLTVRRTAGTAQEAASAARREFTRRTRNRAERVMVDVREEGSDRIVACARDAVLVLYRRDGSGGEPWAVVASHDRLALIYRAMRMLEADKGADASTPIDFLRTDYGTVSAASGPIEFYIAPLEMIQNEGKTIA